MQRAIEQGSSLPTLSSAQRTQACSEDRGNRGSSNTGFPSPGLAKFHMLFPQCIWSREGAGPCIYCPLISFLKIQDEPEREPSGISKKGSWSLKPADRWPAATSQLGSFRKSRWPEGHAALTSCPRDL